MRIRVPARNRAGDEGFAMATVLITMLVLTGIVFATIGFATSTIRISRHQQDWAAALAAAQAGVEDYRSRLNNCDTYWTGPCASSPPAVAESPNWAPVPGTSSESPASYTYKVISTPSTTPGLIRLQASGRVNGVTRSITVDFTKPGFLSYIYYTDYESTDPDAVLRRSPTRTEWYGDTQPAWANVSINHIDWSGVSVTGANTCKGHWYADGTDPARAGSGGAAKTFSETGMYTLTNGATGPMNPNTSSCEIQFTGGDKIAGPLYTRDAMLLNSNGKDPLFAGKTETYWQPTFSPGSDPSAPWRASPAGSKPDSSGYRPTVTTKDVGMPPSNAGLRDQAVAPKTGCLYRGPTRIVLESNGKMLVTSPSTVPSPSLNSYCGSAPLATPQEVSLPPNGVVYVDDLPASVACPAGKVLGTYPVAGDITTYDCHHGDAFVEGTLAGKLTIGAASDIHVTGDTVYKNGVSGTDVLGLVAQGNVDVYHPVRCTIAIPAGDVCPEYYDATAYEDNITGTNGTHSDIEIDAAILSVKHSFTVQNYWRADKLGSLKVVGGIYQRYRGAVGTGGAGSGTGYLKNYVYDTRLPTLPPPYFLEPTKAPWTVTSQSDGAAR